MDNLKNISQLEGAVAAGVLCLLLVVVLSGYLLYQRNKKQKESLFGSTIKSLPTDPSIFPGIETVPVQPSVTQGQLATFDTCDIENQGSQPEFGLSSRRARWSSLDVNSEHSDTDSCSGLIWRLLFKIQYFTHLEQLELSIFRAKCYPDKRNSALETAAYVMVYLLPDEIQKQTSLYPNTGSPSFDETFSFHIRAQELQSKSLRCSLYELDQSRMRICLGHSLVKFAELTRLQEGEPHYLNKDLEHLTAALEESRPEIHVSLCYTVQSGKLKIQLFAARNLPEPSGNKYILSTSVIIGAKAAKTKTTEPCDSLYGLFQCSYAFQISSKHMDACCLQFKIIEIMPDDQGERPYGQLTIGPCMYAHGSGLDHWKQMLTNSKKTIEMWHKLQIF